MCEDSFDGHLVTAIEMFNEMFVKDEKKYSSYLKYKGYSYELGNKFEQLKRGLELDSSGITSFLLLENEPRRVLEDTIIDAENIVENLEILELFRKDFMKLQAHLNNHEMGRVKTDYYNHLFDGLRYYRKKELSKEEFNQLVNNENIAELRFNALDYLDKLKVEQFSQGDLQEKRAKYHNPILGFWSINSLVDFVSKQQDAGVALYAVIDRMSYDNYFVLGIKNGQNITMLSDRPKSPTGLGGQMHRRFPERSFANRVQKGYFPYDLLDVEIELVDDHYYAFTNFNNKEGIILREKGFIYLGEISSLRQDNLLWILSMMQLIDERYFKKNTHTEALSYTGEMLLIEEPSQELVEALMLKDYEKPSLNLLGNNEILTSEEFDFFKYGTRCNRQNDWMEEYYKKEGRLDYNLLFPVSETGEYKSMVYDGKSFRLQTRIKGRRVDASFEKYYEKDTVIEVWADAYVFIPSNSGTQKDLQKIIHYIQRANLSAQLSCLIRYDYYKTIKDFRRSYSKRMLERKSWLLDRVPEIADNELQVRAKIVEPKVEFRFDYSQGWFKTDNCGRRRLGNFLIGKESQLKGKEVMMCAVNGSKPSLEAIFYVENVDDLLFLTGWNVNDLPEPMKHYSREDSYNGNSLLEKVDPIGEIENPFNAPYGNSDNLFHVSVALSKRGYNYLRKQSGKEPDKFWNKTSTTVDESPD